MLKDDPAFGFGAARAFFVVFFEVGERGHFEIGVGAGGGVGGARGGG